MDSPLVRRAVRAGLWMVANSVTERLLQTVRILILARLLTPHDFGLVAIGLTLVSLYSGVSDLGTKAALIQRGDRAHEMFDTTWTLGLIRGVVGSAIQVALAPAIAGFFRAPESLNVIRIFAALPILRALRNVAMVELRGDLRFGPQYAMHSAGTLADLAVSIALAIWLGSAWALVSGMLAASIVRVLLSYLLHPYRPTLRLDRTQVRELTDLGRWMLGTRILTKLLTSGVPAAIGRVLGIEAVGLFGMASRGADLPRGQITKIVAPVSVVAYAKLRESPERLRGAYVRTLRLVSVVATPLAVGVVVYGAELVEVVFGSQWRGAGPLLQVMGVYGLVRALGDTTDPLFTGTGRPWLRTWVQAAELLLVAVLFGPLVVRGGIVGAAWTVTIGAIGAEGLALAFAIRFLGLPARKLVEALAWPLGACLPIVALRFVLAASAEAPVVLAGVLALSACVYVAAMLLLDRSKLYRIDAVFRPTNWRRGAEQLWKETGTRWLRLGR